jgi:hypothetical protein
MGRLFACVLLVAACGDNLVSDPNLKPNGFDDPSVIVGPAVQRLVPAVCSSVSWSMTPTARTVELAVASAHGVTSIFATPAERQLHPPINDNYIAPSVCLFE